MIATLERPSLYSDGHREPYTAGMAKRVLLGIQDFRRLLKARVDAAEKGEETIVQKRGKVVAALIPIEWYRDLRERAGDPTEY